MRGTAEMEQIAEASPRLKARIAGGLWLMVIAAGVTAVVIRSTLKYYAITKEPRGNGNRSWLR